MAKVKSPIDFIDRPIAAILFGLIILVLVLHVRTLVIEYRKKAEEPDHDMHDSQQR